MLPDKPNPPKSKKLTDSPMPPLPFAHQIKNKEENDGGAIKEKSHTHTNSADIQRMINKEGKITIEEADVILKDLREKGKEIKRKLEQLFRKQGVTPEFIEKYINDPSNFSPEIWAAINKKRSEIANSIHFPENLLQIEPSPQDSSTAKTKERRKLGGAHRRGWLPMR